MPLTQQLEPRHPKSFIRIQPIPFLIGAALGGVVLGVLTLYNTWHIYHNRILENIYIDGTNVSRLTKTEALNLLTQTQTRIQPTTELKITLYTDNIAATTSAQELKLAKDYPSAIKHAWSLGRSSSIKANLLTFATTLIQNTLIQAKYQYDPEQLRLFIDRLAEKVNVDGQLPAAELKRSGQASSLLIFPGKLGRELQLNPTLEKLQQAAAPQDIQVAAVVATTAAQLNSAQAAAAKKRAVQLVGKSLVLQNPEIPDQTLDDTMLISFLSFPAGINQQKIQAQTAKLAQQLDRQPQAAVFEYDSQTLKVKRFQPDRNGLSLNQTQTIQLISQALQDLEATEQTSIQLQLPIEITPPETTLSQTNDLGIVELLGTGRSQYAHSIPNRIHNVALTTSRITNIIVPPDAEFSFNQALGEVSRQTGFKPAYVIKEGRTQLGDGGGVCQVSTTLFRAVLDAGLPVTKRRGHSYRVNYYELDHKPGIDATVYAGDVDLRFRNDTGHHLLIYGQADSNKLQMFFQIYGTSDGRQSEIVNHRTWDYTPPPPPLYIDDPSLPTGTIKQIDWAAAGIKAAFTNIVRNKEGEVIRKKTYTTNYRPWQAIYLRGI